MKGLTHTQVLFYIYIYCKLDNSDRLLTYHKSRKHPRGPLGDFEVWPVVHSMNCCQPEEHRPRNVKSWNAYHSVHKAAETAKARTSLCLLTSSPPNDLPHLMGFLLPYRPFLGTTWWSSMWFRPYFCNVHSKIKDNIKMFPKQESICIKHLKCNM